MAAKFNSGRVQHIIENMETNSKEARRVADLLRDGEKMMGTLPEIQSALIYPKVAYLDSKTNRDIKKLNKELEWLDRPLGRYDIKLVAPLTYQINWEGLLYTADHALNKNELEDLSKKTSPIYEDRENYATDKMARILNQMKIYKDMSAVDILKNYDNIIKDLTNYNKLKERKKGGYQQYDLIK